MTTPARHTWRRNLAINTTKAVLTAASLAATVFGWAMISSGNNPANAGAAQANPDSSGATGFANRPFRRDQANGFFDDGFGGQSNSFTDQGGFFAPLARSRSSR